MENISYLQIREIRKSFVGVSVLKGVTFNAEAGEVHGLLGGNGAGKSTLMNILGGIYSKDSGEIYIDGNLTSITSAATAERTGISFVHQELKLFDKRSVAENIMMSKLPVKKPFGFVDDKSKNKFAKELLDQVGLKVSPTILLGELSIAEQQLVEIAKALSLSAKIIIFDEPTSSLTGPETNRLFTLIRKLKADGACIIYISHKFDEIFAICDKVTVLRDGIVVDTKKTNEINGDDLVNMVIGRKLEQYFSVLPPAPDENTETILEVNNFCNSKLNNVSLSLRKGEILGLFGLVGAGRSELMRAIYGLDTLDSGTMFLKGKQINIKSPRVAMKNRISFLTEDRHAEGLVLKMNIRDNLTLPILNRIAVPIAGLLRFIKEKELGDNAFKKFLIKAEGLKQRVNRLSGGNQQKVVLAKWFMTDSIVLLLDEPTRGVDVGAKAEIYELIVKAVEENGLSVILVSSEAPEILGMSHRIIVMRDGSIVAEHAHGKTTEEELILECAGGVGQ